MSDAMNPSDSDRAVDGTSEAARMTPGDRRPPFAGTPHHDVDPAVAGRGETILVVEDEDAIRRLVTRQLTRLGYRVEQAASAEAALARFDTDPGASPAFDLLLTDIVMPGRLDGAALALLVRERWPALKIVCMSGFPAARAPADAQVTQRFPFLSKPFTQQALATLIRAVLDGTA
jgi:DNA-binding NtrC family response regulator